jgi:transcriptional regulator with XRE-family HTH domain
MTMIPGMEVSDQKAWTPPMRRFMSQVKRWRIREGLTQEQAAKRIGVSRQAWSFYERMECKPRPKHLRELSRVTKIAREPLMETYYGD